MVCVTDSARAVQHAHKGQSAPLEDSDLLLVQPGHAVARIRQANKRKSILRPVPAEGLQIIGPNCDNLCTERGELLVVVADARQLRAADWSEETPQESQHHHAVASKSRQPDRASIDVAQFEIGRRLAGCQQVGAHVPSASRLAFTQIRSNMAGVSRPVRVFC